MHYINAYNMINLLEFSEWFLQANKVHERNKETDYKNVIIAV